MPDPATRKPPRVASVRLGALLLSVLFVSGLFRVNATPPEDRLRPNVLVVITDDQRARGTLGVMPRTRARLAGRGVMFTNAFATTPMCCPSRATIFTGRYAHNHGVKIDIGRSRNFDQQSTIQHQLQRSSYRTAIFGKYLNGWDLSLDPPNFDTWAIFGKTTTSGYYGGPWNIDGERRKVPEYSTTFIQRRAVEFIHANASPDKPWAMFLSTAAPHHPFTPEPRFENAIVPPRRAEESESGRKARTKPDFIRSRRRPRNEARKDRIEQLRTMMSVDLLVAEVDRALRRTGQYRDTLVIFLSDNGYMWGEHGLTRKMLPFDGSVRIPLMMRWPGKFPARSRDDRLAATIDIAPTIYEATGAPPPRGVSLDGRSLLKTWQRRRLLLEYWRMHRMPSWAALRTTELMFVEYYDREGKLKDRGLYNRAIDPFERNNLIRDRSKRSLVERLSRSLARDRICSGRTCP